MGYLGDVLTKTLPYDVFDDVLKKPEHRACDAYCDVFDNDFKNMKAAVYLLNLFHTG